MGSLLYDGDGREVVRVSDPEMAEAFFVPFFSSLSFNTHGHNMTDPKTRIDRQLQVFRFVPKSNLFSCRVVPTSVSELVLKRQNALEFSVLNHDFG